MAELFEARKPKEQAVITEIDGRVEMGGFVKGMRKIVIRADNGETKEYLIPRGKHISVHEGDRVQGRRGPHGRLARTRTTTWPSSATASCSGTWSTRCRRSTACRA